MFTPAYMLREHKCDRSERKRRVGRDTGVSPVLVAKELEKSQDSTAARDRHGRDARVTIEMRPRSYVSNSTAIATASPPPMQRESIPIRAFRCRIALSSVTSVRAPLAPMGCPSATAPPFTFSFS